MMILYVEGRIFSWGKSSRGRLGREASSDDSRCPSLVSVAAAARDDDDDDDGGGADGASRDLQVTSLCCSHSLSLVCFTQRNFRFYLFIVMRLLLCFMAAVRTYVIII